ncbi:hypothetical protein EJ06DRAFT_471751 [Trichodelitschia bisporula]|uniref:PXA domain-containing protein n=1 Tax=Trichodelitschia bisporula TaxID=703511 RepID=A0A6G1I688_9PEZI|nr:hypothetical protein EJ06DRAFT_471751 [Trichodelitschia bisporula]
MSPPTRTSTPVSSEDRATTPAPPAAGKAADGSRLAPSVSRPVEAVNKPVIDALSDKATAAFIRRTLCSHHALSASGEKGRSTPRPIDELLPPLTSSNEVDLQLYAILAVIIKEFVLAWYAKITSDHVFVDEVIHTIAHCTRALEQRLRNVDLEALILDEVPQLVDAHLNGFRIAHQPYPHPLASTPRQIYHSLNTHPALSPVPLESDPWTVAEQQRNEEAWRQLLVQTVLAVLLPTEDLENACLRTLVTEILSEMIVGNALSGKVCEGWMLWDGITQLVLALQPGNPKDSPLASAASQQAKSASRLEQFGLVSTDANDDEAQRTQQGPRKWGLRMVSAIFWTSMQYLWWTCTALWIAVRALAASPSLPPRSRAWLAGASDPTVVGREMQNTDIPSAASSYPASTDVKTTPADVVSASGYRQRPILTMGLWNMMGHLMEVDRRMPWLSGLAALMQWGAVNGPGRVGDTNGAFDR